MSMCLSWLCFFMSVAFICTSFQYDGSNGNYSAIAGGSALQNYNEEKYANSCFCYDQWGKIYNLAPLQNTTFNVRSKNHTYSYNPCSPFKTGPPKGGCQKEDVAICWWTPGGEPNAYRVIGSHSLMTCHVNRKNKFLSYKTSGTFHDYSVRIDLKCDESKTEPEQGDFKLVCEREWVFQLTHLCVCGDGCPVNPVQPTTPPNPGHKPDNLVVKVVLSVIGGVGGIVLFVICWPRCRRRRRNDENRPLLGDNGGGVVDVSQNEFPDTSEESELTSGRGSASSTKPSSAESTSNNITVPQKDKDNLNKKIKPYTENLC
ncbi:uncharacterized protein LOC144656230 [Oculina patagonica]